MKPVLKALAVGIGTLSIPAYIVYAQTTPTPTTTSSVPFIPLFVNGATSGTSTGGTAGGSSTWFIDVTAQQIVACTQAAAASGDGTGGTGGGAAGTITCNRQAIPPASATPTPTPTPAPAPAPAPAS